MLDGIQFGFEGPNMTGTWINPRTGHKFTVRDSYFEDNEYKVITTDGAVMDYNMIQNYVQCNDDKGKPIEPPKDMMAATQPQQQSLPQEIADMIDPDDDIPGVTSRGLGNINVPVEERSKQITSLDSEDMIMVKRVLRKHEAPKLNICFNWQVPKKQLDTLVDILGIEPETIAEYYVKQLNMNDIYEKVKNDLSSYITSILSKNYEEISIPFIQAKDLDIVAPERFETTISTASIEIPDTITTSTPKTIKKGGVKKPGRPKKLK